MLETCTQKSQDWPPRRWEEIGIVAKRLRPGAWATSYGCSSIRKLVTKQAGKRPALVLSPFGLQRRVGLALLCPITSQRKDIHSKYRFRSA